MQTKDILLTIKIFGAGTGAFIAQWLGGWDMALKVLVTMTILDYITGLLAALYLKQVSSNISYKGIIKKIGIYIIVAVACLIDQAANTGNTIRAMAIGFYTATEGISLIENWGRMDLPLPDIIKTTLAQLKKQGDDKNESIY